jgi:hypothetical protein
MNGWLIHGVFLAIGFFGGIGFVSYLDSKGRL